MTEFRQKTLSGFNWNMLNQIFVQGLNLITGIILMRLLQPSDFGLVAMVMVIRAFLHILRDPGISEGLIQKSHIEEKTYSTAWKYHVVSGLSLGLLLWLSAPLVVHFYQESILSGIVAIIALDLVVGSLGVVPFARLRKKLNFKSIFKINAISAVISCLIALYLAWKGYGLWALVLKVLVWTCLNSFLVLFLYPVKVKIRYDWPSMKPLFVFGKPLAMNNLLNFLSRNLDDLLIGKTLGDQALGLYNRSYALMLMPVSQISGVISSVLFPSLSIIKDEKERSGKLFLKTIASVSLITFPIMIGLFILAKPIIVVVFGTQWIGALISLQILSLLGLVQSVGTFTGAVFLSQGEPRNLLKLNLWTTLFITSMIIIGVYYFKTIEGVAACYAFASFIALFYGWSFFPSLINIHMGQIVKALLPALSLSMLMGIFVFLLDKFIWTQTANGWHLGLKVISGIIFYFLCLEISRPEIYMELKDIIKRRMDK